jgi:2-succinyl-6-hydroxy-2,4-cyclohexadiene-1-carboxylate synthase
VSRLLANGVYLNVERCDGPVGAPVLLLMHGFTGSSRSWAGLMAALQETCTTLAVDALGHGASDAPDDPARYAMAHVVADTLALLDQLAIDRCALLGYSMGGRMALQLAVAAPQRVRGLILESASPGLRTPAERLARREADAGLARLLDEQGLPAFVARWERLPLWQSQGSLPPDVLAEQRSQRLSNNPWGLAASLRGVGTGAQPSLYDQLATLHMPTLLIAGALDTKYVASAREMHTALTRAGLAIVPDVGHNVHLEAPCTFEHLVRNFMEELWHR